MNKLLKQIINRGKKEVDEETKKISLGEYVKRVFKRDEYKKRNI